MKKAKHICQDCWHFDMLSCLFAPHVLPCAYQCKGGILVDHDKLSTHGKRVGLINNGWKSKMYGNVEVWSIDPLDFK